MAVRVVLDYPRRRGFRVVWAFLRAVVGMVVVLAGVMASAVVLLMMAFGIYAVVSPGDNYSGGAGELFAIASAIAVTCVPVGLRLLRGKRHVVLFLRRFGFADATAALSFAVATGLSRKWRVVTLDDANVAAVGVSVRARRGFAVAGLVTLVLVIVSTIWLFTGGFADYLGSFLTDATASDNAVDQIAGVLIALVVIGLVASILVTAFAVLVGFAITSLGSYLAIRWAERAKRTMIADEGEIERRVRWLRKRSTKVFCARLAVIKVAHPVWRDAVRGLAAASSAIVIDVSEPSENVLWEIETLKADARSRSILVGRSDELQALADGSSSGAYSQRLSTLLDGDEVLAYEGTGRKEMKRFSAALRAKLDSR